MGIVADLPNTTLEFKNPKSSVPMLPISNLFMCTQHSVYMNFAISFDPNPRRGISPTAPKGESWEIGIVQNVLYDMYNFEYDDGSKFKVEFTLAALDTSAKIHLPFYSDPVVVPACEIDPILKCNKYIPVMMPSSDIFITSKGFSEFPDPWTGEASDNKPNSFNSIDQPSFGARLRKKGGSVIRKAESISAFQTWLVAKRGDRIEILSTVPPFSLIFWLETDPSPGMLTIQTPPFNYEFYGEAGITRRIREKGHKASVRAVAGDGGRKPVVTGTTANDRANNWLIAQGLNP